MGPILEGEVVEAAAKMEAAAPLTSMVALLLAVVLVAALAEQVARHPEAAVVEQELHWQLQPAAHTKTAGRRAATLEVHHEERCLSERHCGGWPAEARCPAAAAEAAEARVVTSLVMQPDEAAAVARLEVTLSDLARPLAEAAPAVEQPLAAAASLPCAPLSVQSKT